MPNNEAPKDTISTDFDGVLHNNMSPWTTALEIPDPPVDGAIDWLHGMAQRYFVMIHTVRANFEGADQAIYAWLIKNGLPEADLDQIAVVAEKPQAHIYLDDRAMQFNGTFPTPEEIDAFRPWNKRG